MSTSRLASRTGALLLVAALGAAFETPARAEGPSAAQVAQAEDLFQRAKDRMARKEYDAACPMLAESYKLAGGGGTLQNLAICYEEAGKLASAYNRFTELKSVSLKANRADRVKLAEEHIAKLQPRLSRVRIQVREPAPGLKIEVDGDPFGQASWEAGIVLDKGSHTIRASAPGRKTAELTAKVEGEGTEKTVTVEPLAALPKQVAVVAAGPTTSLAELDRIATERALRTTGFVVGGIGVATMVAGGVFGVLTITTNNAAKATCVDHTVGKRLTNTGAYANPALPISASGGCFAPPAGQEATGPLADANGLRDDARTFANVANVLIPIGAVALGIGTYLVIRSSAPPEKGAPERAKPSDETSRVRASITPTLGGLSLTGTFR